MVHSAHRRSLALVVVEWTVGRVRGRLLDDAAHVFQHAQQSLHQEHVVSNICKKSKKCKKLTDVFSNYRPLAQSTNSLVDQATRALYVKEFICK